MKAVKRAPLIACIITLAFAAAASELDSKAVSYTPVDKIKWVDNAAGTAAQSIIYGDPGKAEPYAYFVKWKAGNMSRPHWHANDRHIVVISGTWWVGTGDKYDPDSTVPMPAGTYVLHTGKGVHYDGAKQGDAILMIHGMGPAASTPVAAAAEKK